MACLKTTLAMCLLGLVTASLADETARTEQGGDTLQRQVRQTRRLAEAENPFIIEERPSLPPFCKGCNAPIQKCSLHVDMTTGYNYMGTGFSWLKPLSGSGTCAKQGVLQLDPPLWAKSLTLHLKFSNPTGWSFNLGDSETNNGYGGDSGTHTHGYAAEVHNKGSTLLVYKNDLPMCNRCDKMYVLSGVITSYLIIRVSHDQLCIYNGDGVTIFKVSKCLFNFDRMFLGINRVIHSRTGSPVPSNRQGSGLCSVCGAWSNKMVTDP